MSYKRISNKILVIAIVVSLITALVLIKPDVFLDKIFVSQDNSYLLVDDFSDTERNCLGGNSSLFYNNASIVSSYHDESLQLDYDVSLDQSYAGYVTQLNHLDLTPYNSVTFLVKGEKGGREGENWSGG